MADIRTPPSTDTYRQGWERIFGKPAEPYVIEKLNKRS